MQGGIKFTGELRTDQKAAVRAMLKQEVGILCGSIRHYAARPDSAPAQLEVWPQHLPAPEIPLGSGIQDVRIYDYVELDQPQLARMWDKRQRGYRVMGYQIGSQR